MELWTLSMLSGILIGLSKAGLKGIGMLAVSVMAIVYETKISTGIVLPLFIGADILAVFYYKRHVKWQYLFRFLPAMIVGVLLGVMIGKDMPEVLFKQVMAFIILASVMIVFWKEKLQKGAYPDHWAFVNGLGIMAGITTMIGNLAGAITNLYFLATKLPKNEFIGTAAYLFFIINIVKLPFHIFVWETIQKESLIITFNIFPSVLIGFWIGLKIVHYFSNQFYRNFILASTALSAILIFLK